MEVIRYKELFSHLGYRWVLLLAFLAAITPLSLHAITPISQGYLSTDELSLGSIVSLQEQSRDHVVASTNSNADNLLGVIISNSNSLLSISNGQNDQFQIATSGSVITLVSDINGPIEKGDQITASPVKGLGMKATSNSKVIGIAQGPPRNSKTDQTYTDSEGVEQSLTIGEVDVLVSVSYYYKTPEQTIIPATIQKVANALAGKKVDVLPIIISAAIFIITLIVVTSIIYSMIRSSIISVGRNPMAQSAVYRDVIQLSALVLGILAVAIILIYVILTRL